MNFLDTARKGAKVKRGVQSITGGAYGGGYGLGNRMYGYGAEGLDYNKEAGARWDNSIVYSILSLLSTTLGSVPFLTGKLEEGVIEPVESHPITELLAHPNPWYDGSLMETGQIFLEGSRGNSYAFKHRSAGGKLVYLELLPEGACFPYTVPGSGDWISYYAIFTATGYTRVPPEDILHMRWMTPNPFWLQIGMSPLEACLPDLVADKLAARHEASLLRNGAVSSLMVSPMRAPLNDGLGEAMFDLTDSQCEQIQRRIDSRITGDSKGSSYVWNVPMNIEQLGFDPTQLALTETRHLSEARLCACFQVPPAVAGLLVGLDKANNRASYAGAVDQYFDGCAIPYMRHRSRQMTDDLVPELGQPGEVVIYDESKIPAIKARLVRELMERTGGPLETVNEGRAELGLDPLEGGDDVRNSPAVDAQQGAKPNSTDSRKQPKDTTDE